MKKTKLLTSLAALALVLGLGACDESNEDEPIGDSTSQDSESLETTESEIDLTAETLASIQNAIEGLGDNPFSDWKAYKYTLDNETRLIKEDENGYPYGYYRVASDEVSYYIDGLEYYNKWNESFETNEIELTYQEQLQEDDWFIVGDQAAIKTILSLTSGDVLSVSVDEDKYVVSYQTIDDSIVLGTTTYTYTIELTITDGVLIRATSNCQEIHTAGSIGEDDYEKESLETIEQIDPEIVTFELLVQEGYDSELWVKEPEIILLGTFDWTGFTDGDSNTSNVTIALTTSQLEDNLSRAWTPSEEFSGHSYSVTSTSSMRAGSHNNVAACDLVGSLECITFGNGRSTTGSMVLTFDEGVNITSVDVVNVLGSTTSNNLTVNGQVKAGYDYRNVTNWNSGAKWDDVPAVTYDDIEQGNTLSMSVTQAASADKIIVHSISLYGILTEN